MSHIKRQSLIDQLQDRALPTSAQSDPRLASLALDKDDLDANGVVSGQKEAVLLYAQLDRLDADGQPDSLTTRDPQGHPTAVSAALDAIAEATRGPGVVGVLRDPALANAFPHGLKDPVGPGSQGLSVTAVQYALGRLGYLASVASGLWDDATATALRAFQHSVQLPFSDTLDPSTLNALDEDVCRVDLITPAARASNPLAFLSDFKAFALSPARLSDRSRAVDWSHPEVQDAYGSFVSEYWRVLVENRVECDCKTLALFFMDQFRAKFHRDTGLALGLPRSKEGALPALRWLTGTAAAPSGLASRLEKLAQVRAGYEAVQAIEKLDPEQSLVVGVNVFCPAISANQVAHAATTVALVEKKDAPSAKDSTLPDVPLDKMRPGDLIFLAHQGASHFSHTVNVLSIARDPLQRVRRLVLGVGSFDDLKDEQSDTEPRGPFEVNHYVEEVIVELDESGHIAGSQRSYASQPAYEHLGRYNPQGTLMAPWGGAIKLGRWG